MTHAKLWRDPPPSLPVCLYLELLFSYAAAFWNTQWFSGLLYAVRSKTYCFQWTMPILTDSTTVHTATMTNGFTFLAGHVRVAV